MSVQINSSSPLASVEEFCEPYKAHVDAPTTPFRLPRLFVARGNHLTPSPSFSTDSFKLAPREDLPLRFGSTFDECDDWYRPPLEAWLGAESCPNARFGAFDINEEVPSLDLLKNRNDCLDEVGSPAENRESPPCGPQRRSMYRDRGGTLTTSDNWTPSSPSDERQPRPAQSPRESPKHNLKSPRSRQRRSGWLSPSIARFLLSETWREALSETWREAQSPRTGPETKHSPELRVPPTLPHLSPRKAPSDPELPQVGFLSPRKAPSDPELPQVGFQLTPRGSPDVAFGGITRSHSESPLNLPRASRTIPSISEVIRRLGIEDPETDSPHADTAWSQAYQEVEMTLRTLPARSRRGTPNTSDGSLKLGGIPDSDNLAATRRQYDMVVCVWLLALRPLWMLHFVFQGEATPNTIDPNLTQGFRTYWPHFSTDMRWLASLYYFFMTSTTACLWALWTLPLRPAQAVVTFNVALNGFFSLLQASHCWQAGECSIPTICWCFGDAVSAVLLSGRLLLLRHRPKTGTPDCASTDMRLAFFGAVLGVVFRSILFGFPSVCEE